MVIRQPHVLARHDPEPFPGVFVVPRQVHLEGERTHGQVRPQHHVRQDRRRRQSMGEVSPPSDYVGTSLRFPIHDCERQKKWPSRQGLSLFLEGVLCAQRLKKVLLVTVRLFPI